MSIQNLFYHDNMNKLSMIKALLSVVMTKTLDNTNIITYTHECDNLINNTSQQFEILCSQLSMKVKCQDNDQNK
jgi:hypothetical protein